MRKLNFGISKRDLNLLFNFITTLVSLAGPTLFAASEARLEITGLPVEVYLETPKAGGSEGDYRVIFREHAGLYRVSKKNGPTLECLRSKAKSGAKAVLEVSPSRMTILSCR